MSRRMGEEVRNSITSKGKKIFFLDNCGYTKGYSLLYILTNIMIYYIFP